MSPRDQRKSPQDSERAAYRRRKYLVDSRMQLASTVKVAALVLVLLVILNAVLAWQNLAETRRIVTASPDLGEQMHQAQVRNMAIVAAISLIILAMVVVRSIMLTHRTAGSMHKVMEFMEEVAAGRYNVTLRLRHSDTLKPMEDAFNKMAGALKRRAEEDAKSLNRLADEISAHGSPVDAEMARRIAEARARSAE